MLLSCGIANAQTAAPPVIGSVPDAISTPSPVASSATGTQQDAQESKPGLVAGTVMDRSGLAAAGAVVRLTSKDGSSRQAVSGDNGEFSFPDVPPGPFKLSVSAEGFGNQEFSGELASGQTYLVPPMVIAIATVVTDVSVTVDPVQVATEEYKEQVQQRVFGFIPNFYVTYQQDAAPLTTKLKYKLAWKSSTDPVTIAGTAFLAGLQQAGDQYGEFGQGAEGYAKRFGAGYADVVASTFLSGAVFPSLLKQDPRYFYQGTGTTRSRLLHAVGNSVWCKGDNGHWQFNYSNVAGVVGGAALSSTFYPTKNTGTFILSSSLVRLGESSLTGVIQEFVLRRFTKSKRGGDNPGLANTSATPSDAAPIAKTQ